MADSLLMTMSSNRDEWELQYGWGKYNRYKLAYIKASRDEEIVEGIDNLANLLKNGLTLDEALRQLERI